MPPNVVGGTTLRAPTGIGVPGTGVASALFLARDWPVRRRYPFVRASECAGRRDPSV